MPHDGHHHHGQGHHHHAHEHTPGLGHNLEHEGAYHLHSHMPSADVQDDVRTLASTFIDGFMQAKDKTSYLRLSGVPFERTDPHGGPSLKLVDVRLANNWQVGTASPGFATEELVYMPFPGELVSERTDLTFVYVSMRTRTELDLKDWLLEKRTGG